MKTRHLRVRAQRRPLADGGGVLQRARRPERARAISAGTQPGERVHPEVVDGDARGRASISSRRRAAAAHRRARRAARRCSSRWAAATPARSCPACARDDWPLADPKGQPLERVREIRDEIAARARAARRRALTVTFAHHLRAPGWQSSGRIG